MKIPSTPTLGAFALLLISTISVQVDARVPKQRIDSASLGCGKIQDELDEIVKDFANASTREEADALLAKGRSLVRDWNALGCSSAFGNWWKTIKESKWEHTRFTTGVKKATTFKNNSDPTTTPQSNENQEKALKPTGKK